MIALRGRRARRALLASASIAIVSGAVHASAPPGQYDTFGRTDRCIRDMQTKLTWLRAPLPAEQSFSAAGPACAALGAGWRVPTVNELLTLVDEIPHYEVERGQLVSKAIDANAFPQTPVTDGYWTASTCIDGALAVNFQTGATFTPPNTQNQEVRCVIFTPTRTSLAACQ